MILGSCNFNQIYNDSIIERKDCFKILEFFEENGGEIIDTAANYKSHEIINEYFRINKNTKFKVQTKVWSTEDYQKCIRELPNVEKFYCLMARENDRGLVTHLKQLQRFNKIEKFGISCYLPGELDRSSYFQCIQIPCDPIWFDYIPTLSLYSHVQMRSYYNLLCKKHADNLVCYSEIIENRIKNKEIELVVGVDNIAQLKEDMERWK